MNERGVQLNPEKVKVTADLLALTNIKELKRALGMINYVGKYKPHLQPLGDHSVISLRPVVHGPGTNHKREHKRELSRA